MLYFLSSLAAASPAIAQVDHSGHHMPAMTQDAAHTGHEASQSHPATAAARHAAEQFYSPESMATARAALTNEHGGAKAWKVMLNTAESRSGDGPDAYAWRGEAWIGGDINRLVVKTEGEGEQGQGAEHAEFQALYSRAISPYFDLQAGLRHDAKPSPTRTYASLGLEGLAPYGWEVGAAAFLSDHGDLSARLEGAYDLRLTQKLILQPRAELNFAASDDQALGVGSGLSDAELGLRLRYHQVREFAPYIGVVHQRQFGRTADLTRAAGGGPRQAAFVVGVRAWF